MIYPSKKTLKNKSFFKTAKLAKFENGDFAVLLKFPFDRFTINQIKTIPGNKMYPDKSCACPLTLLSIKSLIKFQFKLDERLIDFYHKSLQNEIVPIFPKGFKLTLRDFQAVGVGFAEKTNGCFMNCDSMGLGKTIQTLAYLQLHPELRPAVIVCTVSTKLNWEIEAKRALSKCKVQVLSGKPHSNLIDDILIINYDILANETEETEVRGDIFTVEKPFTGWIDHLLQITPKIIIADECHKIKNEKAGRTQAFLKFKNVPHRIGLTGTPIENRVSEFFNILNFIAPQIFPNKWKFQMRYCGPKNNGFGMEFKGSSNEAELHEKLQTVMIRRLKSDVLKELPEKMFSFVPLEMSDEKEYRKAENNFIEFVEEQAKLKFDKNVSSIKKQLKNSLGIDYETLLAEEREAFVNSKVETASSYESLMQTGILLRFAAKAKLKNAIAWIDDFLESDEKLVVFARHTPIVDEIFNKYKKFAVKIVGSTSVKARQKAIDEFQNNKKIRVIIISEAAAEGITLTAACNIAIVELPLFPGKLDQIIDRLHRIGQLRNVIVHYLLAVGTIEEIFAKLIDDKRKLIDKVVDYKETKDEKLILELMKDFLKLKI